MQENKEIKISPEPQMEEPLVDVDDGKDKKDEKDETRDRVSVEDFLKGKSGDEFFALKIKEQLNIPLADVRGEVFNPERQLKQIKQLPKGEKELELERFKHKLEEQKMALGYLREELLREIELNPSATKDDLEEIVEEYIKEQGFHSKQRETIKNVIDDFWQKKEMVEKIREKCPDDAELFKELFGREPHGIVDIENRNGFFMVRCADFEDYAFLYGADFSKKRTVRFQESKDKREQADRTGGFFFGSYNFIPTLSDCIFVINSSDYDTMAQNLGIIRHEEQHARHNLIPQAESERTGEHHDLLKEAAEAYKNGNEQLFEVSLRKFLENYREVFVDPRAKNEILAYFKEGRDISLVADTLLRKKEQGGLYDYVPVGKKDGLLSTIRYRCGFENHKSGDVLVCHFKGKPVLPNVLDNFNKTVKQAMEEVFEEQYKETIVNGLEAIEKMSEYTTKDVVIGRLEVVPLKNWSKELKRFLEQN